MEDGMTAVTEEDLTEMNREELLKRALDLLEKNRTQARFILDQQSEIERLKSEKKVPQESQTDDWKICHVYGKGNRLTNRAELLINTGDAALPLSPSSAITSWSFIGSGCDGKVFKAINAVDGSVSAMKEIHIGANTPEALDAAVENFKDQARLLAKLKHKSIVEFISAVYVLPENLHESDDPSPDHNRTPARSPGTPTETPPAGAKVLDPEQFKASPLDSPAFSQARYRAILYIKMEFCNAGTLEDYFPGKSKEKLSPKECLHLFHGAAAGIAFVHGENVIHRGIKPANIFIAKADGQLQVKIGDFGLSCEADKKGLAPKWVTGGTPMYMSPEQHKEAPHGMSTDVRFFLFLLFCVAVLIAHRSLDLFFREDSWIGCINAIFLQPGFERNRVRRGMVDAHEKRGDTC